MGFWCKCEPVGCTLRCYNFTLCNVCVPSDVVPVLRPIHPLGTCEIILQYRNSVVNASRHEQLVYECSCPPTPLRLPSGVKTAAAEAVIARGFKLFASVHFAAIRISIQMAAPPPVKPRAAPVVQPINSRAMWRLKCCE